MKRIKLTLGKYAIVDDGDIEHLSKFKWNARKRGYTFYAQRSVIKDGRKNTEKMHIRMLGKRIGLEIDHRDGNGLNNRRENLRFCTHAENMHNARSRRNNTSGFKGVSFDKSRGLFAANIWIGGKKNYLGRFASSIDAAKKYNAACVLLFGEFAKPNVIRRMK